MKKQIEKSTLGIKTIEPEKELPLREIYNETFRHLERHNITQTDVARLMGLGVLNKPIRAKISDKLSDTTRRGISKADCIAIQVLLMLVESGIDIRLIKFENGRMLLASNSQ